MSSECGMLSLIILLWSSGVQAQHSVTLSSQSLCAVTGSTVKISCKYTKPDSSSVREREWYQLQNSDGEERVLSKDPQYSARVSVSTEQNNCVLTVRNVTVRDSGVYNFRFRTSSSDWTSASSGVNLTVTELQVKVDPKSVEQKKVKLTCSSTCSPSENHHYRWYRNGEYKTSTDDSTILLDTTRLSDEGSYYCRLSSSVHRSPPVYTETVTDADYTAVKLAASAVGAVLLLMLFAAFLWMRRKRGAETDTDIQTPDPADPTYTALNPTTTSSDYDTLQHRTDSPSDTYAALNPETMCSDYDTLQGVTASHCEQQKILKRRISAVDYENVQRPPSQKPTQISL